jgi:hypothetical protein
MTESARGRGAIVKDGVELVGSNPEAKIDKTYPHRSKTIDLKDGHWIVVDSGNTRTLGRWLLPLQQIEEWKERTISGGEVPPSVVVEHTFEIRQVSGRTPVTENVDAAGNVVQSGGQPFEALMATPYLLLGIGIPLHLVPSGIGYVSDMLPLDRNMLVDLIKNAEDSKTKIRAARGGIVVANTITGL